MINETDIRDMQEDLEGYTNFVESMIMTRGKDRLVENTLGLVVKLVRLQRRLRRRLEIALHIPIKRYYRN